MEKRATGGRVQVPPRFNETIKHLTLGLQEADRYLVYAELPQDTLDGLSQAVDHLRGTVWAVLNSVVDEFSDSQRASVLLTSHRLQRAQQLTDAVIGEIDAGNITRTTQGTEKLRTTLGVAYKKLHFVLTGKAAPPESA